MPIVFVVVLVGIITLHLWFAVLTWRNAETQWPTEGLVKLTLFSTLYGPLCCSSLCC